MGKSGAFYDAPGSSAQDALLFENFRKKDLHGFPRTPPVKPDWAEFVLVFFRAP
jgi:hypothetical protein